ncbi:MAG TPA: transposase [Candidatus Paceibacterota bacterium]
MRKRPVFANGEFYHIYNQGVDKRDIVIDQKDALRLLECMKEFNVQEAIGSLYSLSFQERKSKQKKQLVDIVAYCLNPNHFHFVLRQRRDGGIVELIKRLSGGYTSYFNIRHKRRGPLFGGSYKVRHILDNDYLLHVSAYVNLNNKVHGLKSQLVKSSWEEYSDGKRGLCDTKFILGQFRNKAEYAEFAMGSLDLMLERKKEDKELKALMIEGEI